jgi:tRNA(Met) C34 N-acetyltransferase TmcA
MSDETTAGGESMRRLVRVPVAPELLCQMMREGYASRHPIRCVQGVPQTAELIGTTHDPATNLVYFFWRDESFAPVPLGEVIPDLVVILEEIPDDVGA